MSDKRFVDTNILVYAHNAGAGAKHFRAIEVLDEIWRTGTGVVSTQVLQELCVNLRRRTLHPPSLEKTREILSVYLSWEVVVNGAESVLSALEIEKRYGISFWDGLIVQAAESAGATLLYSEDLSHGQSYGSVRVVNPFRGESN